MATFRLSDSVQIKAFTNLVEAKLIENSKFRLSGVVGSDPRITAKAQTAGLETTLREWKRPTGGEAGSMSDDNTVKGSPDKVQQRAMVARVLSRWKAFSAMEIADYASDADAIAYAVGEFARLRVADEESTLLAVLEGVLADNVANDSGDMLKALHLTTGTITAANKFGNAALLDGRRTMGDVGGDLKIAVMHSDVVNNLRAAEPNAFIAASQTDIGLEKYQGVSIIETDNVGKAGTVSHPIYTTYMVGAGLFAYASAPIEHALEQTRDPFSGNMNGEEIVINRFRYLLHPAGFSNIAAPTNGVTQLNDQLKVAATWDRVAERKAIPLVAIKTNG